MQTETMDYFEIICKRAFFKQDPVALKVLLVVESLCQQQPTDSQLSLSPHEVHLALSCTPSSDDDDSEAVKSQASSIIAELEFSGFQRNTTPGHNEESAGGVLKVDYDHFIHLIALKNRVRVDFHREEDIRLNSLLSTQLHSFNSRSSILFDQEQSAQTVWSLRGRADPFILGLYRALHVECIRRKSGIEGLDKVMWLIPRDNLVQMGEQLMVSALDLLHRLGFILTSAETKGEVEMSISGERVPYKDLKAFTRRLMPICKLLQVRAMGELKGELDVISKNSQVQKKLIQK